MKVNRLTFGLFLTGLVIVLVLGSGGAARANVGVPNAAGIDKELPQTMPTGLPTPEETQQLPTPIPTDCLDPFVDIEHNIFRPAIRYLNCAG